MDELTKDQKLTLIWRHTHKDVRGRWPDGGKNIMVYRQGTTLVDLTDLTDAEIADKLPLALRKEAERLAKKK